jgi:hypothetical protein
VTARNSSQSGFILGLGLSADQRDYGRANMAVLVMLSRDLDPLTSKSRISLNRPKAMAACMREARKDQPVEREQMTTAWLETLEKRRDLTKRVAPQIFRVLRHPDLLANTVTRLLHLVDRECGKAATLIRRMDEAGADETMLKAAGLLEIIWIELGAAVSARMGEMRQSS